MILAEPFDRKSIIAEHSVFVQQFTELGRMSASGSSQPAALGFPASTMSSFSQARIRSAGKGLLRSLWFHSRTIWKAISGRFAWFDEEISYICGNLLKTCNREKETETIHSVTFPPVEPKRLRCLCQHRTSRHHRMPACGHDRRIAPETGGHGADNLQFYDH